MGLHSSIGSVDRFDSMREVWRGYLFAAAAIIAATATIGGAVSHVPVKNILSQTGLRSEQPAIL
jgi:hypothetical protein